MRVLIVNTSEKTGGAAVAANRLKNALNNNGVKAMMLVRDKQTDDVTVAQLPHQWLQHWRFLWERWCIFRHLRFSRKHLFEIDIANTGCDITSLKEFKEADVIHLSWINQGMLSLSDIRKILQSGKAVVWTLHDLWPATGICHYARGCNNFHSSCLHCRLLTGGGSSNDLSHRTWNRKKRAYHDGNIFFVACSRWLEGIAKQSRLFEGMNLTSIPNPIDTRIFHKTDKAEARRQAHLPEDKNVILFVSQRVTDERKGMSFFIEAMRRLVEQHPEMKETTCVAILGGSSESVAEQLPLPAYALGYISSEHRMAQVYNAASVFVLPSLEDNLPNTIMEAMACGVPCVGFRVGGIPEEIDHLKNGYVAEYRSSDDLAKGIHWVLNDADYEALSKDALHKVATCYSQRAVALKYIEVYNQAMAFKNYHI